MQINFSNLKTIKFLIVRSMKISTTDANEDKKTVNWKIEIEHWEEIDLDSAKFVYSQAIENLKFTSEIAEAITTRSVTILLCLVPFLSVCLGFSIALIKSDQFAALFYIFCFIALSWCVVSLVNNIFPFSFMFPGREPRDFFSGKFFDLKSNSQVLSLYLNEIEACQVKIDFNNNQNSDRMKRFKRVLWAVIISVVVITAYSIKNLVPFILTT